MRTEISGPEVFRPARPDVLHALALEHRELDAAFAETLDGPDPLGTCDRLLDVVAVHELAEMELLDPLIRYRLGDPDLADRRGEEQRHLLRLVSDLRGGGDLADLAVLHDRFVDHSDREEIEVFPALRHVMTAHEIETGWQDLQALRLELSRHDVATAPQDRRVEPSLERRG